MKGGKFMAVVIWLAIAAVMIIVEIATLGLTTIWFAGGALVAAIVANFGVNWIVQIILFALVSLVLLICTRPFAVKHLMKNNEKTNVASNVGKSANVISTIDNVKAEGVVKLNGLEWTARSATNEVIDAGSVVIVKEISGNKLIVEKKIS